MSYITRISFDIATEDQLSESKQNRLARDARDSFIVMCDPDEIGLVKVTDLDYELAAPCGHTHYSTRNEACQEGEHSCYAHAVDRVHPTDN